MNTPAADQPSIPTFQDMALPRPDLDALQRDFDAAREALEAAGADRDAALAAVRQWDALRRRVDSWSALANLRFSQDTTDADARAEREFADEIAPKITEHNVAMMRLLVDGWREELEPELGAQAFDLWKATLLTYRPEIQEALVQESKLDAEYTELKAGAKITFRGETLNLSSIGKYLVSADRDTRHEAARAMWSWYADNAGELDRIYDELTRLRTEMGRALGFETYVPLGYARMQRIDYDRHDVERFRAAIVEHVVPLAEKLHERQRGALGVDELMAWDEPVHDPRGNPTPQGDRDALVEQAKGMFDGMHEELGSFFRLMDDRDLLDLVERDGKANGGFCTSFPVWGVPFVFSNFNGTKGDVEVFTHEMGHAFQCYVSRGQPLSDYLWPTLESCEIHSMSLEFLTWPWMKDFFGEEEAERFQRIHLTESLLFLPYGCAVDDFQHRVYENPEATPEERNAMWREVEQRYLPWRNWGDLEHPAKGGRWQAQGHIYGMPFYYIDYVLAQTCALQFWDRMHEDFEGSLTDYVALCRRGGEAPFQELARSAGLTSPFEAGCLEGVVKRAADWLGL